MLVDINRFPGPAIWQMTMMFVLLVWAIWLFSGKNMKTDIQARMSVGVVVIIGFILFVLIKAYGL